MMWFPMKNYQQIKQNYKSKKNYFSVIFQRVGNYSHKPIYYNKFPLHTYASNSTHVTDKKKKKTSIAIQLKHKFIESIQDFIQVLGCV